MNGWLALALWVGAFCVLLGSGIGLIGENTQFKADLGTFLMLAGAALLIAAGLVVVTA